MDKIIKLDRWVEKKVTDLLIYRPIHCVPILYRRFSLHGCLPTCETADVIDLEEYRKRKQPVATVAMSNGSTLTFKSYDQGREPFKGMPDATSIITLEVPNHLLD